MHKVLHVFVSSTAGLSRERSVVESALSSLHLDGERFETWPSSPAHPLDECLRQVSECDAMVLLLGESYGRQTRLGISATHAEYRRAVELGKPVFPFRLATDAREPEQQAFLAEVMDNHFLGPELGSPDALGPAVGVSLMQEFSRCFREVHAPPDRLESVPEPAGQTSPIPVPDEPKEALRVLLSAYERGADREIQATAEAIEAAFPDSDPILSVLSCAEINAGINGGPCSKERVRRAIEQWTPLLGNEDVAAEIHYNLGNARSALGESAAAIEHYEEAVRLAPSNAMAWKNLGTAYGETGDEDREQECYAEALRHNPMLFEALYSRGTTMQRRGEYEESLSLLRRIDNLILPAAQASAVLCWQTLALLKLGRLEEARSAIEQALQLDPGREWSWNAAARVYSLLRRTHTAWVPASIGFWSRFLANMPHDGQGWAELGFAHWFGGASDGDAVAAEEAIQAFEKARSLGHLDGGLIPDRLGHLYEGRGNMSAALNAYRQAASLDPSTFGYCLGSCLLAIGQHEEALPYLEEAATTFQPDALSWFNLGVCLQAMSRFDEAEEAYRRSADIDPEYPQPQFNRGSLLFAELGRAREGAGVLRAALDRFPDYRGADELARILDSLGV